MGSNLRPALYQGFPMMGPSRAQIWSYSPRFRRPRHFHEEPEVNLVASGTAVFGAGEKRVTVRSGELIFFPPGQDHVLEVGSPDLALFAIGLRANYSEQVLGNQTSSITPLVPIRLPTVLFRELIGRAEAGVEKDKIDSEIAELWLHLRHAFRSTGQDDQFMHILTRRTLSLLLREPSLNRAELAKQVRGDKTELSRYFHRDLGLTLVQYRTRLRLLKFIRNVDQGSMNLTSACLVAGFGSYSQCHRQFMEQLGTAPRTFFSNQVRSQMENTFLPFGSNGVVTHLSG
jgi:AraC-like DNA-binding protein